MTSMANQGSDVRPNVLSSQTVPNTLGGLGRPTTTTGLRFRPLALVAAGALILAGLALALALGRIA
jgi:hypothetical protein